MDFITMIWNTLASWDWRVIAGIIFLLLFFMFVSSKD